jgi:hypothetical protein
VREDQFHTYIAIATGQTVIWLVSSSYLYHATVDGLRALCNRAILVRENASVLEDRSNSTMTCHKCAGRVRRVRPDVRSPIDIDAALRRHSAQDLK